MANGIYFFGVAHSVLLLVNNFSLVSFSIAALV